ncbi:methyltransferase domain-containing protein [Marivirga sp. S37H4]|uniref:protein-glutamate O-methyltransferase n=2 Tax=Marivirga aurantiaca TaxID=2802615 RepID=A0A934WX97_9BACT|nr:methyltransferase domain-containing protein [Marivirga aurantiaca]
MQNLRPVIDDFSFEKISQFITKNYGIKLDQSKRSLVESRLGSRVRSLNFDSYHSYLGYVFQRNNKSELNLLVDLITTNKTDFFREPSHFNFLTEYLLPDFVKHYGQNINIWSSACSSGEEVYTLAMVLDDYSRKYRLTYNISGSDLSYQMLEQAKAGVYHLNRLGPIPEEYKKRYMLKSKNPKQHLARFKPEIRNKVVFYQRNLMEPNYGNQKFHVIFCRNVLIYFDKQKQEEVVNRLARQLHQGGYLFLGHSESVLGMKVDITQIQPTIYRKLL